MLNQKFVTYAVTLPYALTYRTSADKHLSMWSFYVFSSVATLWPFGGRVSSHIYFNGAKLRTIGNFAH